MSKMKKYRDFCNAVREERGNKCEGCGRTSEQAEEKHLNVHHLLPVSRSGVDDGLVMSRANVFLMCGWCHKMQHPGQRRWPCGRDAGAADGAASRQRGRDLK